MKFMIIMGSYHRDGTVASLVESFTRGVKDAAPSAEIKVVNLLDTQVNFCGGCHSCEKSGASPVGECCQKDGMDELLREMVACDRLVFATPVYMLSPTALMKRFMERCLPLAAPDKFLKGRAPRLREKKGALILSTGAPHPLNVLLGFTGNATKALGLLCRMSGCSEVERLACGAVEASEKARRSFIEKAFALGQRLAR